MGHLHELPAVEATAILYLRSWCQGGFARERIANDFRLVLMAREAEAAIADFDALMALVLAGARRKLMRHDVECSCFGGDESAFANLIAAAAGGDMDDAMLFAGTLLSAPAMFESIPLARALAQPFLRLARHSFHPSSPAAPSQVH